MAGPALRTNGAVRQRPFIRSVSVSEFPLLTLSLGFFPNFFNFFFQYCTECEKIIIMVLDLIVLILLIYFQGDRNDSEDQPPAKRRLSSAVVKVLLLIS